MKIVKTKYTYSDGSYVIIYHKEGDEDHYHREDGPAYTCYNKGGSVFGETWYIDGKPLSEEQINDIKRNLAFNKWLEQELDHENS